MYQTHDYVAVIFIYLVAFVQAVPAYFGYRVYRLNGYAKYWSEAWILFVIVMLWIGLRRLVVAITFDPACLHTGAWVFDQLVSTAISSIIFTVIAVLKYKFFARFLAGSSGGEEK